MGEKLWKLSKRGRMPNPQKNVNMLESMARADLTRASVAEQIVKRSSLGPNRFFPDGYELGAFVNVLEIMWETEHAKPSIFERITCPVLIVGSVKDRDAH